MRISELARQTRVPIPTIKYYLREGILPRGTPTAANQAEYGDEHAHRLRLVRALTEIGGLSLEATRSVLAAADDPDMPLHEVFGVAHSRLRFSSPHPQQSEALEEARDEVDVYLARLGWRVKAKAPAREDLARALVVLRGLGWEIGAQVFDPYARVADEIASWEIAQLPDDAPRARSIEAVVVGTVVFEVVLTALRRLAEEHHSASRFIYGQSSASSQQRPSLGAPPSARRPRNDSPYSG